MASGKTGMALKEGAVPVCGTQGSCPARIAAFDQMRWTSNATGPSFRCHSDVARVERRQSGILAPSVRITCPAGATIPVGRSGRGPGKLKGGGSFVEPREGRS
jgi:hypothetical protein